MDTSTLFSSKDKRSQRTEQGSSLKQNSRKNIKASLELLKKDIRVDYKNQEDQSRNLKRNITPVGSKDNSSLNKVQISKKGTERQSKRSIKSRKQDIWEESKNLKEQVKGTNRSSLSKKHKDKAYK